MTQSFRTFSNPDFSIRLDGSAGVALPFVRYRLRLHWPLLDGLGELSKFLLRNLDTPGMNLALMRQATGLSLSELDPVLRRMRHLLLLDGELDDAALTPKGQQMSLILQEGLHDAQADIWLDALGQDGLECVVLHSQALISDPSQRLLRVPCDRTRLSDQLHAWQQRLDRRRGLSSGLRHALWVDRSAQGIPQEVRDSMQQQAVVSLETAENDDGEPALWWLPVMLDLHNGEPIEWLTAPRPSDSRGDAALRVDLPALVWSVSYSTAQGLPAARDVPRPVTLAVCGLSGDSLDLQTLAGLAPSAQQPVPEEWQLPLESLLCGFEHETPEVSLRWSRQVAVTRVWRPACVDLNGVVTQARWQHADAMFQPMASSSDTRA